MAQLRINPTRMELKKLKGKLATAKRGHKLLKDKRDELMKQFLEVVKVNKELREKVEAELNEVYASFTVAVAVSSPNMLEEALMLPKKQGTLLVDYKNIMSVNTPKYTYSDSQQKKEGEEESSGIMTDALNYGFAFTSAELDNAVARLTALLPDLIKLAENEKSAQMMADEIERTRRRVNALEYIMMPRYVENIKSISMKLDENERGNTTRLMKVKAMIAEKNIRERQARAAN